jgi:hypothetical protein
LAGRIPNPGWSDTESWLVRYRILAGRIPNPGWSDTESWLVGYRILAGQLPNLGWPDTESWLLGYRIWLAEYPSNFQSLPVPYLFVTGTGSSVPITYLYFRTSGRLCWRLKIPVLNVYKIKNYKI